MPWEEAPKYIAPNAAEHVHMNRKHMAEIEHSRSSLYCNYRLPSSLQGKITLLGMDLFKYVEKLKSQATLPEGASMPENGALNPQQPKPSSSGNGIVNSCQPKPLSLEYCTAGPSRQKPLSSVNDATKPKQFPLRKCPSSSLPFTLACSSHILSKLLKKDAFYNPQKCSKLIRKACEAMAGCCSESNTTLTPELRAAKSLLSMAPLSLSNPTTGKRGEFSAHENNYIRGLRCINCHLGISMKDGKTLIFREV